MSAPRRGPAPEINVTPLVDVVLVLLIIFMVITPKMEQGPAVELPPATNAEKRGEAKVEPLTLSVTATGALFVNEEALAADALLSTLRRLHAAEPERRVVLKGDRAVAYAEVRRVFQACQAIGFKGVSLQVVERAPQGG